MLWEYRAIAPNNSGCISALASSISPGGSSTSSNTTNCSAKSNDGTSHSNPIIPKNQPCFFSDSRRCIARAFRRSKCSDSPRSSSVNILGLWTGWRLVIVSVLCSVKVQLLIDPESGAIRLIPHRCLADRQCDVRCDSQYQRCSPPSTPTLDLVRPIPASPDRPARTSMFGR
jgi:hypothetical protein